METQTDRVQPIKDKCEYCERGCIYCVHLDYRRSAPRTEYGIPIADAWCCMDQCWVERTGA